MYFKYAVDAMGQNAVQMTIAALLTSGLCRVVNGVAKEIQHPCFTPISQVSRGHLLCCLLSHQQHTEAAKMGRKAQALA